MLDMKNSMSNKKHTGKAEEMAQTLRGPGFNSQLSVTSIPGHPAPSSDLYRYCTDIVQSTHIHKNV